MIRTIREVDQLTAIVLEPTFWGHLNALAKFPIEEVYDPMNLTFRSRNN